eukprot:9333609-Heterocapsa_arctica.AAC.1
MPPASEPSTARVAAPQKEEGQSILDPPLVHRTTSTAISSPTWSRSQQSWEMIPCRISWDRKRSCAFLRA